MKHVQELLEAANQSLSEAHAEKQKLKEELEVCTLHVKKLRNHLKKELQSQVR